MNEYAEKKAKSPNKGRKGEQAQTNLWVRDLVMHVMTQIAETQGTAEGKRKSDQNTHSSKMYVSNRPII